MRQGILFENRVIDFLKNTKINNIYRDFVTISKKWQDVFSIDKYKDTIYYMKIGIPIIYQAVLHDKKNRISLSTYKEGWREITEVDPIYPDDQETDDQETDDPERIPF